jgi:hypothetical protein
MCPAHSAQDLAVPYTSCDPAGDPSATTFDLTHIAAREHQLEALSCGPTDGLIYSPADFLTVTATNLYSSIEGRPLRKDWAGFLPMPAAYASNPASFKAAYPANFASIKARPPAYFQVFANSSATWNPFK